MKRAMSLLSAATGPGRMFVETAPFSPSLSSAVVAAAVFVATGCASIAFDEATSKGTVVAYEEFVLAYPTGERSDVARARIDELRWESARSEDTFSAYRAYETRQTGGRFRANVSASKNARTPGNHRPGYPS